MSDDIEKEIKNDDPPTEEVAELMESHDLDKEEAEHVQEIMEEYGINKGWCAWPINFDPVWVKCEIPFEMMEKQDS
jgi:hypothetical protein